MEPLSIASSVIAIIQASKALGVGIKALQKLRGAATEFGELLSELAALQGLLDNFREAMEVVADSPNDLSPSAAAALLRFKDDLETMVTELQALSITLIDNSPGLNGNGEHKISAVQWHTKHGKQARKLRDRAAVCRGYLSTCVDLLGLAQQ